MSEMTHSGAALSGACNRMIIAREKVAIRQVILQKELTCPFVVKN